MAAGANNATRPSESANVSYDATDTIAAIATAPGGAARGMIRLSGPATKKGVRTLFRPRQTGDGSGFAAGLAADAHVTAATAIAGEVDIMLDGTPRTLACDLFYWPTNRSYTREPVAEFHTLGSPPLLAALLEAVCRSGARLAEPGEFTLRAFLAGRLDLTQAEAVLGVIDAHDTDDLHTAIDQLAGNLGRPLMQLRDELLMLLAELEAGLDFVEEDIEFISPAELSKRLAAISSELASVAVQMSSRLAATSTRQVVLVGEPNAGKSSLFNALAARFATAPHSSASAIVSSIRGTTRDYLTTTIHINDYDCELIDTAGIEAVPAHASSVDGAAQSLSADRRAHSLVRVLCIDASSADSINGTLNSAAAAAPSATEVIALTKIDAASPLKLDAAHRLAHIVPTSSLTGAGLDALCQAIAARLSTATAANRSSCIAATADRCRNSLRLADAAVTRAGEIAAHGAGDELAAAEIRVALAELGKIVGAVYTDDLLDRIFKTFCIGK
jgi:tRNA modification GTPase